MLGSDIAPRDKTQTIVGLIGLFCGAIINANIFGEIAVIIAGMGRLEHSFLLFFTQNNTAMENLGLPEPVQHNVRVAHIKNA